MLHVYNIKMLTRKQHDILWIAICLMFAVILTQFCHKAPILIKPQ